MKLKKFFACFLAVALSLGIVACRKMPGETSSSLNGGGEAGKEKDTVTLIYSAADTFNPYTVKTDTNRQLCKLLYEPLVKLDNEFNPVYAVAQSVETKGLTCTVTLKDIVFSDGSALTADDVVYSAKLALGSETSYAAKLYEVKSVKASNAKTVVFSLKKADPYFVNILDFPIIKAKSETVTDSDSVLQPPVGSGRYKVSADRQYLEQNGMYYGETGNIKRVRLINAPDTESVSHYVEIGAADIYYSDMADGKIIRMSGSKLNINLNNMVYIGVNKNYGELEQNALRQAISAGIDREKICRNAYYNNALPATGFFSPVWEPTKAVQNLQINANKEITVENLDKIGYNRLDGSGKRTNARGRQLRFSLLVNSENRIRAAAAQLIAEQLSEYGITVTVVEKRYADYIKALNEGDFQLFLGEIRLTENMDISPLVLEDGAAAYGLKKPDKDKKTDKAEAEAELLNKSAVVTKGLYEGKNTVADVASVLQTEMPFIPVCYRTGVLFYSDNIENVNNSSASDIYFSIESYILG
ncbi:MAG: hypothetical protein IKD04_00445 [Clostridia bacterium]|nr:hypothetical protein [Clostridia bacterium]